MKIQSKLSFCYFDDDFDDHNHQRLDIDHVDAFAIRWRRTYNISNSWTRGTYKGVSVFLNTRVSDDSSSSYI